MALTKEERYTDLSWSNDDGIGSSSILTDDLSWRLEDFADYFEGRGKKKDRLGRGFHMEEEWHDFWVKYDAKKTCCRIEIAPTIICIITYICSWSEKRCFRNGGDVRLRNLVT